MIVIITNEICKIKDKVIKVPLIIRSEEEGWIPDFDMWETTITKKTSFINCTQNFRTNLKKYKKAPVDPLIGYYDKNNNLIIHWKTLIDSEDINVINKSYNGKIRATYWQKRYCTYFSTSSKTPWLHSIILNSDPGYVIHHVNGVSIDNRKENLQILLKREHDSIDHPKMNERKKMFENPEMYWQLRKERAINKFINELSTIIIEEYQCNFVAGFAKENIELSKQILKQAKLHINLSFLKQQISENRKLNSHLIADYLDTYEIEKYLRSNSSNNNYQEDSKQLRLF